MRKTLPLAMAVLLCGCAIAIDETSVFMPRSHDRAGELGLEGEADLVAEGITVRHEVRALGGERIAITRAARTDLAPDAPLIVSCFGNASDRVLNGDDYAAKIVPYGGAVLWDYPGYGDSSGVADTASFDAVGTDLAAYADGLAGDRPLVFWGHSLGGFVCAQMAARSAEVDAVVLETTARNVREVAASWKPWYAPVRLKIAPGLLAYDSADALAARDIPVVIIGAGRDSVLDVELSRSLAEALPEATYLEFPDATHYSAGFHPDLAATLDPILAGL